MIPQIMCTCAYLSRQIHFIYLFFDWWMIKWVNGCFIMHSITCTVSLEVKLNMLNFLYTFYKVLIFDYVRSARLVNIKLTSKLQKNNKKKRNIFWNG